MLNSNLKILFVEDMEADYELALNELNSNGLKFRSLRVEKSSDFNEMLGEFMPDLVISDYSLPQFNGMDALKISKYTDPSIPFIILTGTLNEEIAVECMKAGATDYVIKEHIGKLPFAVKEALERRDMLIEKNKAEIALYESELRYRSMFENNDAVMMLIDPEDGRIIDINPSGTKFYGISKNDFIHKTINDITFHENSSSGIDIKDFTNNRQLTARHIKSDNTSRDVDIFISPISYKGKEILHCIVQDITKRNIALRELKSSLEENRELIREIYHRTKNNMQVIISMLNLQSIYSDNEDLERIFEDMENRIKAMSLVHEKLYQSQNLSRIDLKEYITDLVSGILSGYNIPEDKIKLIDRMENIHVLIDTAVPCGLVVNELITNAIKHAFPGDEQGEIEIKLNLNKYGKITLTVTDNGIGLKKGETITNRDTMGMQIVMNIVKYQLKGEFEFDNSPGVSWSIGFSDNVYEERV